MRKIELLAPAGNMEKLKFAYLYGADACYIGARSYSLRANAKNFSIDEIKEASLYAHSLGKKLYVAVNIVFHNEDLEGLVIYLKELEKAHVDAIIISDLFIINLIKEHNINLKIHVSTQYSSVNYEVVNFLKSKNVERVVLAREASYDDIKQIIDKTGMEVEVFLHGAMCSSYSGRCVLSNYFTKRDANRGGCAQVCRFDFKLYDRQKQEIKSDVLFTLSSKDLMMLDNLDKMIKMKIASLKVEGRMRSSYYIATVISTYREAIDNYYNNSLTKEKLDYYKKVLNRVSNRDNISQFFDSFPDVNCQYYLGRKEETNQDFLAVVKEYDDINKIVTVIVKNYFKKGYEVDIFGPNIETFSTKISDLYDEDNNLIEMANHPETIVKFKLKEKVYQDDIIRIKL